MPNPNPNHIPAAVPRAIVLDLLPLYLSGEASPETRALVEESIAYDPQIRAEFDSMRLNVLDSAKSLPAISSDAELRSLRRARFLLAWQRRFYALACILTVISFSGVGHIGRSHFDFHFFFFDRPGLFFSCGLLALSAWVNYFIFRWRVRATRL
jgi:hypothetical protein